MNLNDCIPQLILCFFVFVRYKVVSERTTSVIFQANLRDILLLKAKQPYKHFRQNQRIFDQTRSYLKKSCLCTSYEFNYFQLLDIFVLAIWFHTQQSHLFAISSETWRSRWTWRTLFTWLASASLWHFEASGSATNLGWLTNTTLTLRIGQGVGRVKFNMLKSSCRTQKVIHICGYLFTLQARKTKARYPLLSLSEDKMK